MSVSHAPLTSTHGTDERAAACVRFGADVALVATHASPERRSELERLVARAFAPGAAIEEWSHLRRALATILQAGDVRRAGSSYDRLRRFVIENDDLP